MSAEAPVLRRPGNAYNIFILVLTIFSLVIMVLLLLPVTPAEHDLLTLYDNVVCVIFLIDFAMNLARCEAQSGYFIGQRGWLDLLGSIPSFGFIPLHRRCSAWLASAAWPGSPDCCAARPARTSSWTCSRTAASTRRSSRSCWPGSCSAPAASSCSSSRAGSPDAQHHDRRRGDLVGARDDHHGRLRRLLPGHDTRPPHRRLRDVRGHRDHRRPREHPREPAGLAVGAGRAGAGGALRTARWPIR